MNEILRYKKLPYLLTILFGLFAYQINHLVHYYADAPTLMYEYKVLDEVQTDTGMIQYIDIEIKNLTNDKVFKKLDFTIRYRSNVDTIYQELHAFFTPKLRTVSPSQILGTEQVSIERNFPYRWGKIIRYDIPVLHPQTQYILAIKTLNDPIPREMPKLYVSAENPILLKEKGCTTWVVEHQVEINFGLLGIWTLLILLYIRRLAKYPPEGNTQNQDNNEYYPW